MPNLPDLLIVHAIWPEPKLDAVDNCISLPAPEANVLASITSEKWIIIGVDLDTFADITVVSAYCPNIISSPLLSNTLALTTEYVEEYITACDSITSDAVFEPPFVFAPLFILTSYLSPCVKFKDVFAKITGLNSNLDPFSVI